ncbi:SLC13 family permease [Poseidonocella sp. HB161398]|uniref:SLC13 family permease n=1 Tax=Poseidonocella sp. HB161398 TaxID=2320855 RepID=UPI0011080771|nr:SLC13 family permease [Poseidonocella sp. HB161398]
MTYGRQILMAAIAALALALALRPPAALDPLQARTLAVVIVTLGLWATSLVPPFLTAMGFFAALLISGLAPPELVFSGYTSAAIWLVTSGFVIGKAIQVTGLGQRLAEAAAPHLSRSYPMLIGGLMLMGTVLGFLMPSSVGRAMLLVPIGMALADTLGLEPGSRGRTGVAVCIAFAANIPGFAILPANLPNMVLTGAADSILDVHFGYADYLMLHFPILGLGRCVLLVALILRLFPAETVPHQPAPAAGMEAGRRQLWLMAILLVTLLFWTTDRVHGINPAWVGLAAAVVLLLPKTGFVTPAQFRESADFPTLLLVSGVLGLGAVVSHAGLGAVLADLVSSVLPMAPGRDFLNFVSLSLLSTLTAVIATMPGVPAVLTPLAGQLAEQTGLPVETVLMTQVIGFSTVLLPYQAPPVLIALGLAKEPPRVIVKALLILAAFTFLVLVPLDFLWWRLLGWI